MLTYDISEANEPIYEYIAHRVKGDIEAGRLGAGERLPSKRSFAKNNGVSTITVQNAYDQLIDEGYVVALPRRGYFVASIGNIGNMGARDKIHGATRAVNDSKATHDDVMNIGDANEKNKNKLYAFDFTSNETATELFPFSVWARILRDNLSHRRAELFTVPPAGGVMMLRRAVSEHLASFRGLRVRPENIVIGAGTEYLYSLIVQLLGRDKCYCVESPGYGKPMKLYEHLGARCTSAALDDFGMRVDMLESSGADIAHVSPNHHFPTGITMPISRRYELLAWAGRARGRYIIEDDYDSEFRLRGRPVPTLMSVDAIGSVVYMNTFTKSLAPTIRVSYMALPDELAQRFRDELSFYACPVPNLVQYTLADFITNGYFERHINRMRRRYARTRDELLTGIRSVFADGEYKVMENGSGLHLVLRLETDVPDDVIRARLEKGGVKIRSIGEFYFGIQPNDTHEFIISYAGLSGDKNGGDTPQENKMGLMDALTMLRRAMTPRNMMDR